MHCIPFHRVNFFAILLLLMYHNLYMTYLFVAEYLMSFFLAMVNSMEKTRKFVNLKGEHLTKTHDLLLFHHLNYFANYFQLIHHFSMHQNCRHCCRTVLGSDMVVFVCPMFSCDLENFHSKQK